GAGGAVAGVAGWCAVHLIDEHDGLERVALHHSDPAIVARSEELERQSPLSVDDEEGIGEVIRTGHARIFTDVQASAPGTTKPPGGLEGLRKIGARSVIVVPLLGAMKTAVGTITLASVESVRRLTPADLCTACLVTLGPGEPSPRLTVALAGHQPALLIDSDGSVTPLGTPGTLLGVVDPVDITETKYELRPGQTLLLYTDGVIEAGRPDEQLGEAG